MSSLKKNFIYNAFYQILIIAIPLVTTPYISRIIGAKGVGIYSYSYSVAHYFVIFIMLGMTNYGNRTIASVRDDKKLLSQTFADLYITQLIPGVILSVAYFFYSSRIAKDSASAGILGLYVLSAIFDINWFFYGMESFRLTVTRNTLIKVLCTVSIFLFVKKQDNVYIYCFILAASNLVSQIALWPFLRKSIQFTLPDLQMAKRHIRPNLILFTTVLAVSLFKIMDKIMLGILTDTAQVGFYESSEKVISIPVAFVTALGTVMLPRVTNMVATGKEDDGKIIQTSILLAMFCSSSICFGIMTVSDVFVPLFYGEGFEPCIDLFKILLPSCLFLAFANVIRTQYLLPHKMDRVYVISAFLGAAVNLLINYLLIPQFQANGAAIGTLVAEIVVCIYQSYHVNKCIPVKEYVSLSLPLVLAGLAMYLVVSGLTLSHNILYNLLGKIAAGVLVYALSASILMLPQKRKYCDMFKR